MRSHITIAVLLLILTGVAGCMTSSNGTQHSSTQTSNGGSSSSGSTGGTGGMGGGGY